MQFFLSIVSTDHDCTGETVSKHSTNCPKLIKAAKD